MVYMKKVNKRSHYDNIISCQTKSFVTNMECTSLAQDIFRFWDMFLNPNEVMKERFKIHPL